LTDVILDSAVQLASAIHDKKISSEEVVAAHIKRIEEVNPKLNAVVQLSSEIALEGARKADTALSRGEAVGPLHGVPITLKDSHDTVDFVSTGGMKGRASYKPAQDGTAVARLRAAGAIVIGKTNTPELTYSFETDNLVYGRTNNPYDASRSPGGSSGGAAAIVAAGGSPLDLGSDTWGSIRQPSHFCGIAGIKPTSGRVPRTGHIISFGGLVDWATQIGPMARYVEDLKLTLPLIAGPDWRDPYVVPMPLSDPNAVDIKTLRFATFTDNGIMTPTPETIITVENAARKVADEGAFVEVVRIPEIERSLDLISRIFDADAGEENRLLLEKGNTTEPSPSLRNVLDRKNSDSISTADYARLVIELDQFRSTLLAFMEGYDAIICPVNAYPAQPHGVSMSVDMFPGYSYTTTFNLTGWPAAVVRGGTSPEGLPIGVQIVARPWREDVALAVAGHIEHALGGWQRPTL
jgi:amidase